MIVIGRGRIDDAAVGQRTRASHTARTRYRVVLGAIDRFSRLVEQGDRAPSRQGSPAAKEIERRTVDAGRVQLNRASIGNGSLQRGSRAVGHLISSAIGHAIQGRADGETVDDSTAGCGEGPVVDLAV